MSNSHHGFCYFQGRRTAIFLLVTEISYCRVHSKSDEKCTSGSMVTRQKLNFGVAPGLWVPILPGNSFNRLLVNLLMLREWARGSNKIIIIWSPYLSGF